MIWNATMELRWSKDRFWIKKYGSRILEQKWISDTGKVEWRTVPTEV